ncbi:terpenoid synthase [Acaromyces ingoldii]|uniref:(2E,6E)-farnesyl diphosphate synthase n=1 Tax=Acaromyces ingoldii TaxID=215250 RepID=A0A316YNH0_9BASI|nr:terpenoid synthase [Acaromyces ingoldii]PWN90354.1 terpenoid synthase [Acaromyces ingoldii]
MAKATNGLSPNWDAVLARSQVTAEGTKAIEGDMGIDEPLSPREVLNDFNPHMESIEGLLGPATPSGHTQQQRLVSSDDGQSVPILATQRRLAEITEMIHVASLLHDDVIDASSLRRGEPSAPAAFGNKLSILGGDFLLGRASVALARLRDNEVVELLATVIANLVEGEVMQLRAQSGAESTAPSKSAFSTFWQQQATPAQQDASAAAGGPTEAMFEHYMQKTYLKTAALIGKSARASVILGGFSSSPLSSSSLSSRSGSGPEASVKDAAYSYGRNVGMAFQLIDDVLDFKSTSAAFGKPSGGADLRLGLATAPVLFAWQEIGHKLGELVHRKFEGPGDVEKALGLVQNQSTGLQRTEELAKQHVQLAIDALHTLPWTEARDGLQGLAEQVINRIK